jgi:hypothetical protein
MECQYTRLVGLRRSLASDGRGVGIRGAQRKVSRKLIASKSTVSASRSEPKTDFLRSNSLAEHGTFPQGVMLSVAREEVRSMDRQAGGHNFAFGNAVCEKCGMTRTHFLDHGQPRCEGKPPEKRERILAEDGEG